MHLEHTGGTTIQQVLYRQYPEAQRYLFYIFAHPGNTAAPHWLALDDAARRRYRCLMGHLYYGVHRHVPGPWTYVTLLRHPVDRIIASYYYFMRKPHLKDHARYVSGAISLADHIQTPWYSHTQLARILGGDDTLLQAYWVQSLPPDALTQAKAHLTQDFGLVGLVERYDESLLLMQKALGWQRPITYVRRNVATNRPKVDDLPPDLRAEIEAKAADEIALYAFARARFDALVDSLGPGFQEELAAFRAANARYQRRQRQLDRIKAPLRPVVRRVRRRITRAR